jgi:hypothetical protein
MVNQTKKKMTVIDLYNILVEQAKDKSMKEMNITAFHSNDFGADMIFDDAYRDRKGRKSMQKLTDKINFFFENE